MCSFNIEMGWIISFITSGTPFITLSSFYVFILFYLRRGRAPTWMRIRGRLHISGIFTPFSRSAFTLNILNYFSN
jgi:hypothetical protein